MICIVVDRWSIIRGLAFHRHDVWNIFLWATSCLSSSILQEKFGNAGNCLVLVAIEDHPWATLSRVGYVRPWAWSCLVVVSFVSLSWSFCTYGTIRSYPCGVRRQFAPSCMSPQSRVAQLWSQSTHPSHPSTLSERKSFLTKCVLELQNAYCQWQDVSWHWQGPTCTHACHKKMHIIVSGCTLEVWDFPTIYNLNFNLPTVSI